LRFAPAIRGGVDRVFATSSPSRACCWLLMLETTAFAAVTMARRPKIE
jgi:hypothetical protein